MTDYPKLVCTLPDNDATGQVMEWNDIRSQSLRTERLEKGIAVTFDIAIADQVEDLASREAACCGFLSLTTTRSKREIRLEVASDIPEAMPVIEMILGSQ